MVRRKKVWGSIGTLVLGATLVTGVAAQSGLPGTGWFTSATIQNVGANPATVSVTAYGQGANGGTFTGATDIAVGGSKTFLPGSGAATGSTFDLSTPLPSGFVGSMVVDSSELAVAVSQVGNNQVGSLGVAGGRASAIYRGTNTPGTVLTYPTVKNSFGNPGKITVFSVQAAGADVNYTATIKSAAGQNYTKTGAILANRAVTLLPSDFGMPAGCAGDPNTAACIGSLRVEATGSIAGAVVETVAGAGVATQAQSTALFSTADASNSLFCPVIKNKFDVNQQRYGGITVQNMGNTDTTVSLELTYTGPTASLVGTKYNSSILVPANASRTFLATLGNVGGMPENSYASAKLTTNGGMITASVNESNFGAAVSAQKATSYSCFAPVNSTAKVALPQVKEAFGGTPATTGVSVQNVGSVETVVDLVYVCQGKANQQVSTLSLGSGAGQTFFLSPQISDSSLCAVTATARNSTAKIVAIAQESSDPFGGALDTKNYEGFNLQ